MHENEDSFAYSFQLVFLWFAVFTDYKFCVTFQW